MMRFWRGGEQGTERVAKLQSGKKGEKLGFPPEVEREDRGAQRVEATRWQKVGISGDQGTRRRPAP